MKRFLNLPEVNVAIFGFMLNFIWEMFQISFYEGMRDIDHLEGVFICTRASLGDVVILLAAFWIVASFDKNRNWPIHPAAGKIIVFTVLGVVITVVMEILATGVWHRWSYNEMMPVIPLMEVGAIPILQWILLPPVVVWFVHRQLT